MLLRRHSRCIARGKLPAAGLALLASLLIGLAPVARADILIGAVGALTGPNAYLGEQHQHGVEAAVADLNAVGGVLGQQVRVLMLDDACDADQAVAAAQRLVAAKVAFVAGHLCSGASIPAAKVYDEAGIIQMTSASTHPRLTEEGRANVFRICGRDDQQGTIAGDHLAEHWRDARIAILHDGSVYGKGLADETRGQLGKRGIREALYEGLVPGQSDYAPLVAKLRAAGIAVAYYGGYHQEAALLVREARAQGYDLQFVSGDALATDTFWQITGPAGEGTRFTFFSDARRHRAAAEVVERFRQQGFEPEGYTLYSYAAVQAWAQAVAKAGTLDTKAVIAALRAHEFDTVLGRIGFDHKGDVKQPGFAWYVWQGGRYLPHD
ncbi:MAG TPA: branched-chain amino acid ABC transporter substrate-binding protein [Microvirga sp.]|nr:branched-chain amino acid ABC transporter substrate-binding protein [Microvirga sp.]